MLEPGHASFRSRLQRAVTMHVMCSMLLWLGAGQAGLMERANSNGMHRLQHADIC